jgi:alpha-L-rhamnosidase
MMTADHQIEISASGDAVTTWLDGTQVDQRTLTGDQLRSSGTIGFLSASAAVIRSVNVQAPGRPTFYTDFSGAGNPFEAGDPSPSGLNLATAGANPATADTYGAATSLPAGVGGKDVMLPIANPAPLLRDDFITSARPIASARLYVAAGGYPTLTVNGAPVTVDGGSPAADGHNVPHLTPDQTNYDKSVLYDTFDVTGLISSGAHNVLGAELGRGWYGLTTPDEWFWQMADYHGAPRLLAKLAITYADGTAQTIVSDPATWKTMDGPTTFDSVYTGEKYDARIAAAIGRWRSPGYDAGAWGPATEMNPPGSCMGPKPAACHGFIPDTPPAPSGFAPANLQAQENEPVLVNQVLRPVAIYETSPGSHVYIFDFGQIMTGWPHLHLAGIAPDKPGVTVRMRQDEALNGAGTAAAPFWITEGNGFVDADAQTHYYTLSSAPTQDWEPSFSYAGYRYLEVRGLYDVLGRAPDVKTDASLLTAEVARSGFASSGGFSSSNALLDRIWQNVRWAEQNNSVAKETDTPTREKNGWTGDAQAGSESEMLDFDMSRFFTQWLREFPTSQISTGEIPKIVPAAKGGYGYDQTPGWNWVYGPVPAWDAAAFVIPWELYQYYGDDQVLRELYPTQKRLMDYYATRFTAANDYTYSSNLGEYGAFKTELVDPVTPVINNQYYFYFADYMAKVAALLGDTANANKYRALANAVLAAFVAKYWNSGTGAFTGDPNNPTALAGINVESVNALALAFGMVPGATPADKSANQARVAAAVADDLKANGDHIQAGVYGLHYLFSALDQYGYTDLAYSAATQTTPPSYGDQIAQGATSLWELWETTSEGQFSHDHHYFSSIGTWFYQGLAGIRPAAPGYRSVSIIPHIPSNLATSSVPASVADELTGTKSTLDRASASIRTPRGLVSSAWRRTSGGRIDLRVCLPGNTPAQVWVPTLGQPVDAPAGAAFVRHDTQGQSRYDVYSIQSGCYEFNRGS